MDQNVILIWLVFRCNLHWETDNIQRDHVHRTVLGAVIEGSTSVDPITIGLPAELHLRFSAHMQISCFDSKRTALDK